MVVVETTDGFGKTYKNFIELSASGHDPGQSKQPQLVTVPTKQCSSASA
jgi:hypothetical protein